MRRWLVIFLITSSFACTSQVKTYTWTEAQQANPDSVFSLDCSKLKWDTLPQELFHYSNLRKLNLEKNKLQSTTGLEKFKDLTELYLGKNKLETFPLAVCQLQNLRILDLNRNQFVFIPSCATAASQLEKLILWDTPVGDFQPELSRWTHLNYLDLSGIRFNDLQQEKIRNLFPKAKIHLDPPCDCMH